MLKTVSTFNSFEDETIWLRRTGKERRRSTFNSFEDETTTVPCGKHWYSSVLCLSIPLRMKRDTYGLGELSINTIFQFLWGWNLKSRPCVVLRATFTFQFLWGWNACKSRSSSSQRFLTFNSFEDETQHRAKGFPYLPPDFQFLWGWNFSKSPCCRRLGTLSIPLRMKPVFNMATGFAENNRLSIPLRMKLRVSLHTSNHRNQLSIPLRMKRKFYSQLEMPIRR